MKTQQEKSLKFVALHQAPGCFLIPNPWDKGSAILLESMGFEALATTGAGYAFGLGQADLAVGAKDMLGYFKDICDVTDVPVSADMQNGFGDSPESAAQTLVAAAQAGLVGGSIEDANSGQIYDIGLARARIEAAAAAARGLNFKFMLTARAENHLYGHPSLGDTIKRLQAYQEAGADVLYAPGIQSVDDIKAVLSAIDRPMNLLMGFPSSNLTVAQVGAMGVKRVSIGGSMARAAFGALKRAAAEMLDHGTFAYAKDALPGKVLNDLFTSQKR